jgi:hypothetical protein
MIVRLELVLKVAQFFLQLFGFRFERFHPLLDFRMFVSVLFGGH